MYFGRAFLCSGYTKQCVLLEANDSGLRKALEKEEPNETGVIKQELIKKQAIKQKKLNDSG
jgi:hypothetical protein